MARKSRLVNDYIGKKFGKWTIIESLGNKKNYGQIVKCKCDCGNEANIRLSILIKGRSTKCIKCRAVKHRLSTNRLHRIWYEMIDRCYNKNNTRYADYGKRGILVYDKWKNDYNLFMNWALDNGYKNDLTLDRINYDGNYEPSNCRWATYTQQVLNRRRFKVNTSGYTGISYIKRMQKWKSDISINYKHIYLGTYFTQKEALEVRNKYIVDNELDYPIQEYKGEIGSLE